MRFAVHRPGNPVASPRFHGVPRRDVACRVHVGVAGEMAGHAPECRLALAGFLSGVPARAAALRGVRGWYLLDPPGGLVFQAADQQPPAGFADAAVEAGLGRHVRAGRVLRAPGGAHHVLDLEVFDADHVEAPREAGGGLLRPVLAPVRLAGLQPGGDGPGVAAPVRPAPGLCEIALGGAEPPCLTRGQAGAEQQLARGQGGGHRHAPVDPHDLAGTRSRHRRGNDGERDVPAARAVPGHPERLRSARHRAGPAEPHPSRLRDLHRGVAAVEPPHVARPGRDDPETLVSPGLAPPGPPQLPAKKFAMACRWSLTACCWTITDPSASQGFLARASVSCRHRSAKPGMRPRPGRYSFSCSTHRFHTYRASEQCRSRIDSCSGVGSRRYRGHANTLPIKIGRGSVTRKALSRRAGHGLPPRPNACASAGGPGDR